MAHQAQFQFIGFVKDGLPTFFKGKKVLEIGSLDINGSARKFYDGCDYVGIDVGIGPGVDIVCGGQDFDAPEASFDVVTSFEAMEHNPYWRETFKNMIRLCRPGGLVLMSCATLGRPEHGTTRSLPHDSPLSLAAGWDYYKNLTADDFKAQFELSTHFDPYRFYYNYQSKDLYFVGFRKGNGVSRAPDGSHSTLRRLSIQYLVRTLLKPRSLWDMIKLRTIGETPFLDKQNSQDS